MKTLLFSSVLLILSTTWAAIPTVSTFNKTGFCSSYGCIPTSPFEDKSGSRLVQYKLAKEPLNLDLVATLGSGESAQRMTFKFTSGEAVVDKKALELLLKSLSGKEASASFVEKINTAALVKTKKDQLMETEALKENGLSIHAGLIINKPTVVVDIE